MGKYEDETVAYSTVLPGTNVGRRSHTTTNILFSTQPGIKFETALTVSAHSSRSATGVDFYLGGIS